MANKTDKQDKLEHGYIIQTVDDLFNYDLDISMQILERTTFRNILYYLGEQWMDWARKENIFRRIVRKDSLPTPVSNIIRDYVRSMKAVILNKDFKVSVWPNSEDQDDVDAAKMGETLLTDMDTANDEEFLDEKEKCAMWTVMAGTAFMRTFPELDRGEWFFDQNGDTIKTGEVVSENVPLFNVAVDSVGDTLNRKRWVGIKSIKSREWVEDTFHKKLSTDENEQSVNYQKKLMKLVANVSPWKGSGLESLSTVDDEDMVVFKEVEYKPDVQYPDGRYVATSCGQVLFAHERMPIPVDKNKWEYSLTDFHYFYVPGRFWSDAGVNDLISPQNTINQIDQTLEVNRKSLGRPMVMMSGDTKIQRMTKYGQHLLVLKYDALLAAGIRPEIKHGVPLPSQVLNERDIHRQAAQEAAGDPKNVMRGQAPSTQASGVLVDTLREAAEQGHFPDIVRFYRSLKRVYRKRLILAKNLYTEDRMIKSAGKGKGVQVRAFTGASLRDNTDVRLELSSGISSTKSGQTQVFLKLIEAGLFSAQSEIGPEFREELLRRMGLSGFSDKTNADVIRAQGENSMIANTEDTNYAVARVEVPDKRSPTGSDMVEIPYIPGIFLSMNDPMTKQGQEPEGIILSEDPIFKYDNHSIHYGVHRDFIVSAEFSALGDEAQQILITHTDIHKMVMKMQMDEEMQRQAMMEEQMGGEKK
jgi:hypothetical protein